MTLQPLGAFNGFFYDDDSDRIVVMMDGRIVPVAIDLDGDLFGRGITGDIRQSEDAWDDLLRSPLSQARRAESGEFPPDYEQLTNNGAGSAGVHAFHFSPARRESVFFTTQMPHPWRESTNIFPHIHWTPKTAAAGDVVWELEYWFRNNNSDLVTPNSTVLRLVDAADGVALKQQAAGFGEIDMSPYRISCTCHWRLSRVGDDPEDTYPDDAVCDEIDSHARVGAFGTPVQFGQGYDEFD